MLDIQAELHGAGQPFHDLYDTVVALKRRHDLHPCAVRPRDGMSLRNEHDRDAVQDLGLLVKDLDAGLVDFPSVRDGEEVLLCWRLGEDEVAFWHGYDDGFAGRRPL